MDSTTRIDDSSWQGRADDYRRYAGETVDALERLFYLQRAHYCEMMALRRTRASEISITPHIAPYGQSFDRIARSVSV